MQNQVCESARGVFLQLPYMFALNDPVVAIVCSQIHYWYLPSRDGKSKLRIKKDGNFWIAKSREEWSLETGLTDAQVRRALNVLADKGVIEKRVLRFNGAPTNYVRALRVIGRGPLKEGQWLMQISSCVSGGAMPDASATDHQSVVVEHLPLVTEAQSITDTTHQIKKDTTQNILASNDAKASEKIKNKFTAPEGKKYEDGEIQTAGPTCLDSSMTGNQLQKLWKKLLAEHYCDETFLEPQGKQVGQFSNLAKTLGSQAFPVVSIVVPEWGRFKKFARERSGAYPIPQVPNIGFLLKCAEDALNFWQKFGSETALDKHANAAVDSKKAEAEASVELQGKKAEKAPAKVSDPDDEKMSFEQLLAFGQKYITPN